MPRLHSAHSVDWLGDERPCSLVLMPAFGKPGLIGTDGIR
jgi:hypothetical protein